MCNIYPHVLIYITHPCKFSSEAIKRNSRSYSSCRFYYFFLLPLNEYENEMYSPKSEALLIYILVATWVNWQWRLGCDGSRGGNKNEREKKKKKRERNRGSISLPYLVSRIKYYREAQKRREKVKVAYVAAGAIHFMRLRGGKKHVKRRSCCLYLWNWTDRGARPGLHINLFFTLSYLFFLYADFQK